MNRKERMKWLGTIALILGAVVLMVYAIVASWKANHAPGIGTGQKPAKEVLSGWIENIMGSNTYCREHWQRNMLGLRI